MRTRFSQLEIGEVFHKGKSKGIGYHQNTECVEYLRKDTPSTAVVIKQEGFGNKRREGLQEKLGANTTVWRLPC